MSAETVTRPVLRYHGGKWRLAPWIIGHFPPHRVYVEPYGGAGSVLLRKRRAYGEVYNDLCGEVVTLFRILRDPALAAELTRRLELTPFARAEFEAAYRLGELAPGAGGAARREQQLDIARCLIVRAFMGFGSDGHNAATRTGFRANSSRSHTTPAHDWASYPDGLAAVTARLRGVVIERRPAMDVARAHDGPETLHYLDPPYMPETRSDKSRKGGGKYHAYRHEMDEADHAGTLAEVTALTGMVVISGYASALYDDALASWHRVERAALCDGARPRTEVLWINAACGRGLDAARRQGELLPACAGASEGRP